MSGPLFYKWVAPGWLPVNEPALVVVAGPPTQVFTSFRWPVSQDDDLNQCWLQAHWARVTCHAVHMGWAQATEPNTNAVVAVLGPVLQTQGATLQTPFRVRLSVNGVGDMVVALSPGLPLPEEPWLLHMLPYQHANPRVKHNARQQAVALQQHGQQQWQADDVWWQHPQHGLTETTIANTIGLSINDAGAVTVRIPPDENRLSGLVEGCVRALCANNHGITVVQQVVTPAEVAHWQGMVLTNSVRGVWPVKQVGTQRGTTVFAWPNALQQVVSRWARLWPSAIPAISSTQGR